METITKSVIKLSEIPEELRKTFGLNFDSDLMRYNTYKEYHIDDSEYDALTLWLLNKYPTLKRKISFLIHID